MDLAAAIQQHTNTAPHRRAGLLKFLAHCPVDDTTRLTPAHTIHFLQTLLDEGIAPMTIHGYRSAVNALYRWLLQRDLVAFDAEALRQETKEQAALIPKEPQAGMEVPAEEDVRRLVEAAYAALPTHPADTLAGQRQYLLYLRNIAIVETLRATGIRPGELIQLRLCDLDQAHQVAHAPDGRLLHFDLENWGPWPATSPSGAMPSTAPSSSGRPQSLLATTPAAPAGARCPCTTPPSAPSSAT